MTTPIDQHEGRKYLRTIHSAFPGNTRPPISVDVYSVLKAFKVKDQPAGIEVGHAIKKLLCPGERGKGDYRSDLVGAIAALNRAIDNLDEDANQTKEGDTHDPVITVKNLAKTMSFADYEAGTNETAIYPPKYAIAYCLISLIGEMKELIDKTTMPMEPSKDMDMDDLSGALVGIDANATILQKFSKLIRDNHEVLLSIKIQEELVNVKTKEGFDDELGDALYYLCQLARSAGTSLEAVAIRNNQKLLDRKARGVLGGSGDKR